jgi:hypothetical protein
MSTAAGGPPPPSGTEEDRDPGETRAVARLPGLDIAVLHRPAGAGRGERVTVTLQATAPHVALFAPGPAAGLDPVGLWLQMVRAAWTPWLAMTGALWTLPQVPQGPAPGPRPRR